MIRRYFALFVFFLVFPTAITSATKQTNVLIVITDEHNFRTLGCYRKLLTREQAEMWGPGAVVPTPHIDQVASEGVLCTRAYATSPVCSPCRAAMITGRYPHAAGVPANDFVLDRKIPSLADRLNDAGYRTSFIGKWHLGGKGKPEWAPEVDGGFQHKSFMFNRGHWKRFVIENGKPRVGARKNGRPGYGLNGADEKTFATDWLTDRAIEFMTDNSDERPFLMVLSLPDPHGPNTVRAPYDRRFDGLKFKPPRTYNTGLPAPKWMPEKKHPPFKGESMSKYFGMVQCIDDNLGKLVAKLKAAGQWENTLFVLTSDHGDLCYEHDAQNKGNPYEGSARIPLIFRHPQTIKSGQVMTQPVGSVDLTPTVMGLLELEDNKKDQGRNLAAALQGTPSQRRDQKNPSVTFLRNAGRAANWVAAIDSRYKLILSVKDDPYLFDNEQDPDELLNFYKRPGTKGVAERLAKALKGYGKMANDPYVIENPAIKGAIERIIQAQSAGE